jgi:hypothetical protein
MFAGDFRHTKMVHQQKDQLLYSTNQIICRVSGFLSGKMLLWAQ